MQTVNFSNGDTYTGEVNDGEPQGKGKIVYHNGFSYEGLFERGKAVAPGIARDSNDQLLQGLQKMQYLNSGIFEGIYVNGQRSGYGVRTGIDYVLQGEYRNDQENGHGVEKMTSGHIYEGNFELGDRKGEGVYMWPDGQRYEGQWVKNKREGQGIIIYSNGDKYQGHWIDDKKNGEGVLKMANGDEYCGSFVNGMIEGQGILKYANGNEYSGTWVDDVQEGVGIYVCNMKDDGTGETKQYSVFGDFSGGQASIGCKVQCNGQLLSGAHKVEYLNNCTYEGDFEDGAPSGFGKQSILGGISYVGEFVGGQYCGFGSLTFIDGTTYEGLFSECGFGDVGIVTNHLGQLFEQTHKNGDLMSEVPAGTEQLAAAQQRRWEADVRRQIAIVGKVKLVRDEKRNEFETIQAMKLSTISNIEQTQKNIIYTQKSFQLVGGLISSLFQKVIE